MIKTGIFGGSFNPIHLGHIAIANKICNSSLVDELWLMVSPQNPLKVNQQLLDDDLRLHLAKIATRNYPQIKVSDFEYHLPKPSYMYYTLEELCKTYPERTFALIIGADNWQDFPKWYNYEKILEQYQVIVYPRKGYEVDTTTLPSNVTYLPMELYDISSTAIRQLLEAHKDISAFVDAEVGKELMSKL